MVEGVGAFTLFWDTRRIEILVGGGHPSVFETERSEGGSMFPGFEGEIFKLSWPPSVGSSSRNGAGGLGGFIK